MLGIELQDMIVDGSVTFSSQVEIGMAGQVYDGRLVCYRPQLQCQDIVFAPAESGSYLHVPGIIFFSMRTGICERHGIVPILYS